MEPRPQRGHGEFMNYTFYLCDSTKNRVKWMDSGRFGWIECTRMLYICNISITIINNNKESQVSRAKRGSEIQNKQNYSTK